MFKLRDFPTNNELQKFEEQYPSFNKNNLFVFLNALKKGTQLLELLDDYLSEYNLLHGRFMTLMILERSLEGEETISALAQKQDVKKPTMTRIISSLQSMDLIEVIDCGSDARAKKVKNTPKAINLLSQIMPGYYSLINDICSDLTDDEAMSLIKLLGQLKSE